MSSDPSSLWNLSYIFQRLECVFLYFEQFDRASSAHADQMTIARANGQLIDFFQRKRALSKGFVFESIDEEKFIVGLSEECTLYRKENTMNFGYEGEK